MTWKNHSLFPPHTKFAPWGVLVLSNHRTPFGRSWRWAKRKIGKKQISLSKFSLWHLREKMKNRYFVCFFYFVVVASTVCLLHLRRSWNESRACESGSMIMAFFSVIQIFAVLFIITHYKYTEAVQQLWPGTIGQEKCTSGRGLKYISGDALTDSPTCIGPNSAPYPRWDKPDYKCFYNSLILQVRRSIQTYSKYSKNWKLVKKYFFK